MIKLMKNLTLIYDELYKKYSTESRNYDMNNKISIAISIIEII